MVKRVFSLSLCILMLASTSVALAGNVQAVPANAPCAGVPYAGGMPYAGGGPGMFSSYWGDAPFPGLCGGVVALPFLVVGSLLGGNTMAPQAMGPYGPGPAPYGFQRKYPANACGPYGGSIFSGIPGADVCSGLLGGLTGGQGLLY